MYGLCACVYVFMSVGCACVCVYVCAHVYGGPKLTLHDFFDHILLHLTLHVFFFFFFNHTLLHLLRQSLLMSPEPASSSQLASQPAWRFLVPATRVLKLQVAITPALFALEMGSRDLNSRPHACAASTLFTDLSLQSHKEFVFLLFSPLSSQADSSLLVVFEDTLVLFF